MKLITKSVFAVICFQIVSCAALNRSKVPGVDKSTIDISPVRVSDVMIAIKAQLGEAFVEVSRLRAEAMANNNPLANSLRFKQGKGVFSGETQIVQTGGGKVTAIIPFTGYSGSLLTPEIDVSGSATSTQNITQTFSFNPEIKGSEIVDRNDLMNISIGEFLRDSVVSAYREAISVKLTNGNEPYAPKFVHTELKISTSFVVVRKIDAGVKSVILVPAPDLNSISPSLGSGRLKKGVYKLDLTFPMLTGDPADPRKLFYSQFYHGNLISVEEPYTQERYEELTEGGPDRRPGNVKIWPFGPFLLPPQQGGDLPKVKEVKPVKNPDPF